MLLNIFLMLYHGFIPIQTFLTKTFGSYMYVKWLKIYDFLAESKRSAKLYDPLILKLYNHFAERKPSLNWKYTVEQGWNKGLGSDRNQAQWFYTFSFMKNWNRSDHIFSTNDRLLSANDRMLSARIIKFHSGSYTLARSYSLHDRIINNPIPIRDG